MVVSRALEREDGAGQGVGEHIGCQQRSYAAMWRVDILDLKARGFTRELSDQTVIQYPHKFPFAENPPGSSVERLFGCGQ
jgi:hypothetical protein